MMAPQPLVAENLIQNNKNFAVGSQFSNYMGGQANMGWIHLKVLLREGVKYTFGNLFLQFLL